ncbi:MAG: flavocytochrome c [Oscillospiraceae bacterium]|nr:flavocytochrome c [Oscillospiraceae bacterium]
MKKFLAGLLVCALCFSLAACTKDTDNSTTGKFKAGKYTGTAQGYGGEVTATVVLSKDKIDSITVKGDKETSGIGGKAIEVLPPQMVEAQSTQIDVMASATMTSNAIIEAVNAALKSAGVDPATLTPVNQDNGVKTTETVTADIVIVGAGGAGMTAAIKAKQEGNSVVIIEKMPLVGGNTVKATGGMNAAETSVQKNLGIEDSVETFIKDTMDGGKNVNNIKLVTVMAENSADAIDWLAEIGAPLPEVSFSGGATNKRIHRPEGGAGVGSYLVDAFSKNLESMDIPVYLNTTASDIIVTDGTVTGVKAASQNVDYTFNAKAVILATGGFGANEEMYTKYRPDLAGFVTTNTSGAMGEGIVMAQAIGANLVDIEQIQTHPTVEQGTSIMITESVRGGGAILVNKDGARFANEMETRDVVSAAIIEQEGGYAYLIFDDAQRKALSAIEKYVSADIVKQADTIEGLAVEIGADSATLASTIETWNKAVAGKSDAAYERATGMDVDISTAPYSAIKVAPGVHHTMGGVEIDTATQVIDTDGKVIPGLFAAGEVTGGVHGANRIGGNAVCDIVVFGRIAADSASDYCEALNTQKAA